VGEKLVEVVVGLSRLDMALSAALIVYEGDWCGTVKSFLGLPNASLGEITAGCWGGSTNELDKGIATGLDCSGGLLNWGIEALLSKKNISP
jgi:hypothetical protein